MYTYTPPGGWSAPSVQQQNTAMATQNPQQPTLPPEQQAVDTANQNLVGMQTPDSRQGYITNSDIPAMGSNYDQLARSLYDYDKMNLQPAYANKPGTPSDAISYGRVGPSELAQLTPEMAAGPDTLYADNPKYALTSQYTQKDAILDILKSLNTSIGSEFSSKRGQYKSTVESQKTVLETALKVLGLSQDKELKLKELERSKQDKEDPVLSDAMALKYDLKIGSRASDLNKLLTEGKTGGDSPMFYGSRAVAEVEKQGGGKLLSTAKLTKEERISMAEEILRSGGVKKYLETVPLNSIPIDDYNSKKDTDRGEIIRILDRSLPLYEKDQPGGTGPFSKIITDATGGNLEWLRTEEGRNRITLAENIKAQYAQMISGKVISDKEIKRLEKFVPDSKKTERMNHQDMTNLRNGLMASQEVFDYGRRHNLTANEAYNEIGDSIWEKYGFTKDGKIAGQEPDKTEASSLLDKYWPKK